MNKIARVASLAGVASSTVRLWESHGLLLPERSKSGQRHYSDQSLERAKQIAEMRNRGLKLEEIRKALGDDGGVGTPKPTQPSADTALGPRVRALRLQRALTLAAVAQELSVSASLISTFERTSSGVAPALERRILAYFQMLTADPHAAIDKAALPTPGLAALDRHGTFDNGIDVRRMGTGRQLMDAEEWRIAPGATSGGTHCHQGEELIYVVAGRFEITIEGRGTVHLQAGDSIYFESARRHSWINRDESPCRLLWVNAGVS